MARQEREGVKVFLLGASAESNQAACCHKLTGRYSKLSIANSHDGYFSDDLGAVKQVNDSKADMLFVAFGSPKQEKWTVKYCSTSSKFKTAAAALPDVCHFMDHGKGQTRIFCPLNSETVKEES